MKYISLYLINTGLFVVLFIVYYFSAFLLGYASNNSHELASWVLFAGFVLFHIIVNINYVYHKFKLGQIITSCIYVFVLYGCIAYYFAG
jgi:hypothetical protein